jgi:hypothetical protein
MATHLSDERVQAYIVQCLRGGAWLDCVSLDERMFSEFSRVGYRLTARQLERCYADLAAAGTLAYEDGMKSAFPAVRLVVADDSGPSSDLVQPVLFSLEDYDA